MANFVEFSWSCDKIFHTYRIHRLHQIAAGTLREVSQQKSGLTVIAIGPYRYLYPVSAFYKIHAQSCYFTFWRFLPCLVLILLDLCLVYSMYVQFTRTCYSILNLFYLFWAHTTCFELIRSVLSLQALLMHAPLLVSDHYKFSILFYETLRIHKIDFIFLDSSLWKGKGITSMITVLFSHTMFKRKTIVRFPQYYCWCYVIWITGFSA